MVGTTAINSKIKNSKLRGRRQIDILFECYCVINGINLENTSDIVFFHNMNKDKQTSYWSWSASEEKVSLMFGNFVANEL